MSLTGEEQRKLKEFLNRPEAQALLARNPRNPDARLPAPPAVKDDHKDHSSASRTSEDTCTGKRCKPGLSRRDGILKKTPTVGPSQSRPHKTVWFGPSVDSPSTTPNSVDKRNTISNPRVARPLHRTFSFYAPPSSLPSTDSPTTPAPPPPKKIQPTSPTDPDSSDDHSNFDAAVDDTDTLDTPSSVFSSSSSSLPSVGSPTSTSPSSTAEDRGGNATEPNSSEDEQATAPSRPPAPRSREAKLLARRGEEVRREVALSARAYLGRRHDEYSTALAADPDAAFDRDEPYAAQHRRLSRAAHRHAARGVRRTALLHWAGVARARREERTECLTRLRAILRWAEDEGKIPLSPGSVRACTDLRWGIFSPLGAPDPGPCREAALASLAQLRPRLDLTLRAFLFNEDALRLLGGLVGYQPRPSDLARMDELLRELEVYAAVCAHRRGLIVGHLRRTREFPTAMAAQFGDLRAALHDAEEARLSAARRCFDYVAERSRCVMTYPDKRRRRMRTQFAGRFGPHDREKLEYLSGVDDEAEGLLAGLEAADEWHAWCRDAMARWASGWRPGRVEKDMLYVDEDTQADVRRYQWEINQKRAVVGLVPVKRTREEGSERQQKYIRLLDGFWKLMT